MKSSEQSNSSFKTMSRASMLCIALTFCASMAAQANTWQNGDVVTYTQSDWAETGSQILSDNYNSVYASTNDVFLIGVSSGGHFADFTSGPSLLAFFTQDGAIGPLNANSLNPTATSAGGFGGEVAALKLNVDFSAAGITRGNSGLDFGDLVFQDTTVDPLDGLSVSTILADGNILLGGSTVHGAGGRILTFTQAQIDIVQINGAFENGMPSAFAQHDLLSPTSSSGGTVSPAPEIDPSGLAAGLTMLLGVLAVMRGRRPLEF